MILNKKANISKNMDNIRKRAGWMSRSFEGLGCQTHDVSTSDLDQLMRNDDHYQ